MSNLLLDIRNELERPLILDGAMGSLLESAGIEEKPGLWVNDVNVTHPDVVRKIHLEYIQAGAEILTSNTFRAKLVPDNIQAQEKAEAVIKAGLSILHQLKEEYNFPLIAASNGPVEDCYQIERKVSDGYMRDTHKATIEFIVKTGCDFILHETFSHLDEILFVSEYCSKNSINYGISLYFDEELKLLSGEPVKDIIPDILSFNPWFISFNCISPLALEKIVNETVPTFPWGFYLNCGESDVNTGHFKCTYSPEEYAEFVADFVDDNLLFAGSCCGSSPEFTSLLSRKFYELY